MIKYNNLIYGTLNECVNEIWKMIDYDTLQFPNFDYAALVSEDLTLEDLKRLGNNAGSSWFGVKNMTNVFDSDTISLFTGHYSGGGINSLEIDEYSKPEDLIDMIIYSTEDMSVEVKADEYVLFELVEE